MGGVLLPAGSPAGSRQPERLHRLFSISTPLGYTSLLATELITLTPPVDTYSRLEDANFWGWFGVKALYQIRPALITGLWATLFLRWPVIRDEFLQVLGESETQPANWLPGSRPIWCWLALSLPQGHSRQLIT